VTFQQYCLLYHTINKCINITIPLLSIHIFSNSMHATFRSICLSLTARVHPVSKTQWAMLRCHSSLSTASCYASFQVTPTLFGFWHMVSIPIQLFLSLPGFHFVEFNTQCTTCIVLVVFHHPCIRCAQANLIFFPLYFVLSSF